MSDFSFQIPQKVLLSSYGIIRLGEFVQEWGDKFMIVMDPILTQVDAGEKITKPLTDRKLDFFTFSDIEGPADTKTLDSVLKLARQAHIDGIVAAGGSKAISLGRAVAKLYNDTREIYTALEKDDVVTPPLPIVCVPTTIRDRFMFTKAIPLVDSRSSALRIMHSVSCAGDTIICDPNLTLSLANNQTSSIALETMALIIEAYISPRANFFSDMAAEKAMELYALAYYGTESLDVTTPREELMSQAGLMASLASATSSLGITSLLAVCINSRFATPSALVAAILLPYIVDDAAKFRLGRLAHAARILKATEDGTDDTKAAVDLADQIRKNLAAYNLPARLKDLNLSLEQLSLAAEDAGKTEFIHSLPRSMSSDDLFALIKTAY